MIKPTLIFLICLSFAASGCGKTEKQASLANQAVAESQPSQETQIGSKEPSSEEHSANGIQETPRATQEFNYEYGVELLKKNPDYISEFVRRIFQDSRGHFWFGTNGDGVLRFDGESLETFSRQEGFQGFAVRGIVEDQTGNVWFATENGLIKYDGETFTNFTEKDGLPHDDLWCLTIDSKGVFWIGTFLGVCQFDGESFTPFEIPDGKPDLMRGVTSAKIVHSVMEDSKGRMWFGTNGGAYQFDGESLTNISKKDGLPDNNVNCILEDSDGNFWFATHHQGVCRWDGKSKKMRHFTAKDGVLGTEAWDLHLDSSGNVWFPVENYGVYRFDGKSFTNFHKEQGLASHAVQSIFEDNEGRIWAGGWLGLFRNEDGSFFAVNREGPW